MQATVILATLALLAGSTLQTCVATLLVANNSWIQTDTTLHAVVKGTIAGVDVNNTFYVNFGGGRRIGPAVEVLTFDRHENKKCEDYLPEINRDVQVRLYEYGILETELLRDGHYEAKFLCLEDFREVHPRELTGLKAAAFSIGVMSLLIYISRRANEGKLLGLRSLFEICVHLVVIGALEPFTLFDVPKHAIARSEFYFYVHLAASRILRHYLTLVCLYDSLLSTKLTSYEAGRQRLIKTPFRVFLGVIFLLVLADVALDIFFTKDKYDRCQPYMIRYHRAWGSEGLEDTYMTIHKIIDMIAALVSLPSVSVARFLGLLSVQQYMRAELICLGRSLDLRQILDYCLPAVTLLLAFAIGHRQSSSN